jgi:class 3 adenylate cyclase
MADLPKGTVTFLFTDVEGSTRLAEQHRTAMPRAQVRHDALLREAIAAHGGTIFRPTGDGACAVFATAPDAVAAAESALGVGGFERTRDEGRALPLEQAVVYALEAVPEGEAPSTG